MTASTMMSGDLSHSVYRLDDDVLAWFRFPLLHRFEFPPRVNAVLSTYALTLIPDCGRVVSRACDALASEGRRVVLDMAWPRYCTLPDR